MATTPSFCVWILGSDQGTVAYTKSTLQTEPFLFSLVFKDRVLLCSQIKLQISDPPACTFWPLGLLMCTTLPAECCSSV